MAPALQAAVMTPPGRGAVAVIRILGDYTVLDQAVPPLFRPINQQPMASQPVNRILFGRWGGEAVEDVVVCRIHDQILEISCHGGDRAVERILQDWRTLGAEVIDWQRMLAATRDGLQAELQDCLSRTQTWRTADYVLHQAEGVLQTAMTELQHIAWTPAGRARAGERLGDLLNWSQFGLHLTQPWKVVLTGKPNVGKSSLINALLGYQRSIVYDQPGTTRDAVTATTAFGGWPMQLTDTAGIRSNAEALEAEGIARARQQIAEADLVLNLIDVSEVPDEQANCERSEDSRQILVAHKCDLPDRWGTALPTDAIRVSSITGDGLESLQRAIAQRLIPHVPDVKTPMPLTLRQVSILHSMQDALRHEFESSYYAAVVEFSHGWS